MRAEKWQRMRDSYRGYCTACRKWTRDMTEPDAEEYDCPICGCDSVMGGGDGADVRSGGDRR